MFMFLQQRHLQAPTSMLGRLYTLRAACACLRALHSVPEVTVRFSSPLIGYGRGAACYHAGIAESVASSALRQALNKQDDVLGPWVPGRDPLEDALAAYAGTALPSWRPCAVK